MPAIRTCHYNTCYYNNNLESACVNEKITVNATGMCESLMHCDECECINCEQFEICTKEKKQEFLKTQNEIQ
jgi:hypothetical protein